MTDPREPLGRLVRQVWVNWAREQPDAKASWLAPWEHLTPVEQEVDMRIGEAIAVEAAAVERERIRQLAISKHACVPVHHRVDDLHWRTTYVDFAPLLGGES